MTLAFTAFNIYVRMDKDGIKNLMTETPHFDELDHNEVDMLAHYLEYKKVIAGTVLIKEGQVGDTLFYILSGKVEIRVESMSAQTHALTERGKGYTIGELAVVGLSNIRSATVTAVDETALLLLTKQQYENLIEKHPKTALKILKSITAQLSQRIHELSGQVADFL